MSNDLLVRRAERTDIALVLDFIRELAEYERLTYEMKACEGDLEKWLFGEHPVAEALVADYACQPAGFALFFHNFSTFLGKPGIYLEDLFVRPALRGKGVGKALLREVVRLAWQLVGTPDHLSVHPGALVISPGPMTDIAPLQ